MELCLWRAHSWTLLTPQQIFIIYWHTWLHNCKKDTSFIYTEWNLFYWNCEISPCCFTPSFIVGYLWSSAQGVAISCSLCVFQAFVWWQMTSLVSSDSKFTCHFMCLISSVWNAFLSHYIIIFQHKLFDSDAVVSVCVSIQLSPAAFSLNYKHYNVGRNILSKWKWSVKAKDYIHRI